MTSTGPELIDASNAEKVLACAELITEDQDAIPHSREKVDQIKATLRQLAKQSDTALRATALCWLIFNTGENFTSFERAWRQFHSHRK